MALSQGQKDRLHRHRFGDYTKKTYCESCGKIYMMESSRKLLIHHIYFDSCPKCMPNADGRGTCKIREHLMTVCKSCHAKIHKWHLSWQAKKEVNLMQQRFIGVVNQQW